MRNEDAKETGWPSEERPGRCAARAKALLEHDCHFEDGGPLDQGLAGDDIMAGPPVRRPQAARGRAGAGPSRRRKEGSSARRGP